MASGPHYLPRQLDRRLVDALASSPVVLLDGPRGAGKTTSARNLTRSAVLLPRDLPLLQADPETFLRSLEPPVLVDEWQLAGPELLWLVKDIVDQDGTAGRFVLTGSVEPARYGPTYPLTGRALRLVMRPMTSVELEGLGDQPTFLSALDDVSPAGAAPVFSVNELTRSGFPATRKMADPRLFLDAYAALVSQRAGDEGRDASRLLRTMRVLATLEAQAVPDQRIWEAADINKVTWKAYEDLLTRTYLTEPAPSFDSNRLSRLTTYPKRFFTDTALGLALAGVEEGQLRNDPALAGRYLESFVFQQLRPQVDLAGGALHHLRTSGGEHEVDAVIELSTGVVGIEVQLGPRPGEADARHLMWLRDRLGDRFGQGYVVHTGAETYLLGERIWALPVTRLAGLSHVSPRPNPGGD